MKTWINNLMDSVSNCIKSLNVLRKLFDLEINNNPNNSNSYYELNELNKTNTDNNFSKFLEIQNISSQMLKTCILSISKFSNKNITEIDMNNVLDSIGFLNNELCISEFECNLIKDIKITNASKCIYDILEINNENINLINFNTLSKVFRNDITYKFSENTISDDSLKSIIHGDIISNIKVNISVNNESEWMNKINNLYNNTFKNPVITDKELIPETHYNNTTINISNKEVSEIYNKGVISYK